MPRVTATEAGRSFSDVLNRVSAGEEIEVVRSGARVAVVGPPKARLLSAAGFRQLIASAPGADDDFAEELRALRESVGAPRHPGPS